MPRPSLSLPFCLALCVGGWLADGPLKKPSLREMMSARSSKSVESNMNVYYMLCVQLFGWHFRFLKTTTRYSHSSELLRQMK